MHQYSKTTTAMMPPAKPSHSSSGILVIPPIDFTCKIICFESFYKANYPGGIPAVPSASGVGGEVKEEEQSDDFLTDLLAQLDPPPGPS